MMGEEFDHGKFTGPEDKRFIEFIIFDSSHLINAIAQRSLLETDPWKEDPHPAMLNVQTMVPQTVADNEHDVEALLKSVTRVTGV